MATIEKACNGLRWRTISWLWSDPVIAVAVFVFAAFWGGQFVGSGKVQPQFYQREFAPAVMEACGKGFVSPADLADIPGLVDFLLLKQASFSCDRIPPHFKQHPPNALQATHRYLMGAVAMDWRFTKVSWNALLPLYALLFGLSSAAVYGVFRLGMGKLLAAAFAMLFLLSPLQLTNLPHLRDYTKAPFIIAIVFLLGWLVKYQLGPRKTVLIGALVGVVLGVGIGFRMDLLIFVPAVVVTLVAFTPSGLTKDVGSRFCAMGAFVFFFVALGWPILLSLGGGGNIFHVILLGLFSPFDQALNILPSTVYEWGYLYNDVYASVVLNSYAHRLWNIDMPIRLATQAYDLVGGAYCLEIFRQFPADIVTRFFAAVVKIVQCTGLATLPWSASLSPFVILTSLIFMAVLSLRIAIFSLLALFFLSSYPALQFHPRHFFHLQMLPLFYWGFLGQQMLRQGWRVCREKLILKASGRHSAGMFPNGAIKHVSIFFVLLALLGFSPFVLRAHQQAGLRDLLKNYEQLPIGAGGLKVSNNADGTVRLRPSANLTIASSDRFPLRTGYWGLELDGPACGRDQVSLQIKYLYSDPYYDASRRVTLDTRTPLRYIFHTYSSAGSQYGFARRSEFDGIDVSEDDLPCIKKFGEIEGFEKLPLLMNLTFHEGWEDGVLYQTIGRESGDNSKSKRAEITLFTYPENLVLSQKQADSLLGRVTRSTENMSVFDKSVSVADGIVTVKGDAPTPFAYALCLPAEKSRGGQYLIADGELFDGGLTLGLLKNNQWAGQVNITTAGKFKIVMKPDAGTYIPTLAHNVPRQKFNHFRLNKLGWVPEIPDNTK